MKAMILAAGLGTRLLPLTEKRPKPLFPILDRPLIDTLIRRLEAAGCQAVIINTHHLAHMIDEFVETVQSSGTREIDERRHPVISSSENSIPAKGIGGRSEAVSLVPERSQFAKVHAYSIPVVTRFEPTILGTGGAIKNVEDFWDEAPFLVINGDIFTNIDLAEVYSFHQSHKHPITMVLHDYQQYNHVWVDSSDHIIGFGEAVSDYRKLAFTGIHVLDPQVLRFIPQGAFYSIIDAYCEMIREGHTIQGFIAQNHYWHDIGTITGYQEAGREALARKAFNTAFTGSGSNRLIWSKLKGDGSDRTWYRVSTAMRNEEARKSGEHRHPAISTKDNSIPDKGTCPLVPRSGRRVGGRSEADFLASNGEPLHTEQRSIIIVDHGQPPEEGTCEADSFVAIGRHMHNKNIPVPSIFAYDRSSGLVALEDLGDLHLQSIVHNAINTEEVAGHYEAVIDLLVVMGVEGANGFDPGYTYQTPCYDQELILEKESKYFVEAFLNNYLGIKIDFMDLMEEFDVLAQRSLDHPYTGLLHRDFQSRNILVKDEIYYVIDFQGARLGPLQYDLASLLIDPYVELPSELQLKLLYYYMKRLSDLIAVDADEFLDTYAYCALNRNLQILGAFGFLSRIKGKKGFEKYIPPAISSLKARLQNIDQGYCPKLQGIIQSI